MKESRVFELDQVTAEQVLEAVTTFLRSEKGMEVQSVATPNGYLIQAAQADTLRTLSGMKLATTARSSMWRSARASGRTSWARAPWGFFCCGRWR